MCIQFRLETTNSYWAKLVKSTEGSVSPDQSTLVLASIPSPVAPAGLYPLHMLCCPTCACILGSPSHPCLYQHTWGFLTCCSGIRPFCLVPNDGSYTGAVGVKFKGIALVPLSDNTRSTYCTSAGSAPRLRPPIPGNALQARMRSSIGIIRQCSIWQQQMCEDTPIMASAN